MANKNNGVDLNSFYSRSGGSPAPRVSKKKKAKRNKALTAVISVVLVLAILFSSLFVYALVVMGKINRDSEFNDASLNQLGISQVIDKSVINIALFGVDTRELDSFSGRSDSIMILSVNKKDNTIKLVSIMRDSLVPIEKESGTTYGKINSAYASGGPVLAVKTLNTLFGLDIRDYATVNFYGMADIIDAVGGIEVEITQNEIDAKLGINAMINEQCIYLDLNPRDYFVKETGVQHLNGVQAVAYARIRHAKSAMGSNNDYGRTERQRLVMKLLLEKALSTSPLKYPSLINKLTPYIKTSLSNSEMLSLALFLVGRPEMIQSRVPHDEYIIDDNYKGAGSSAVYYNYEFAGKVLRAFFYDNITPEDYFEEHGVDKTKWFTTSGNYISENDDEPSPDEIPDETPEDDISSEVSSDETPSDESSSDDSDSSDSPSSSDTPSENPSEPEDTSSDTQTEN